MLSAPTHKNRQAFDPVVVGIGLQANVALAERAALRLTMASSTMRMDARPIRISMRQAQQDVPWFWSDQHELNLQVLGMPSSDAVTVQRGHKDDGKFCLFQFLDGRLHTVVAVNMPREVKVAKR